MEFIIWTWIAKLNLIALKLYVRMYKYSTLGFTIQILLT